MHHCILCKNKGIEPIFYSDKIGNKRNIVRCKKCGFMFMNPMPTKKDLLKLYSYDWDSQFGRIKTSRLKSLLLEMGSKIHENMQIRNRLNFIKGLVELDKKDILEVGCSNGKLLKELNKKGSVVKGIEPSKESEIAKKNGIEIIGSDVSEVRGVFDVILIFMVIEHLNDPIKELKSLRKLLKKNGLIIIEVPNTPKPDGLNKIILESVFNNVHTLHFNSKSLEYAILKSGFKKLYSEEVETKKIFNQNIYDFYPEEDKKINYFNQFLIITCSLYLLLLYFFGRSTNKKVEVPSDWKGPGNWLRFVAIKK